MQLFAIMEGMGMISERRLVEEEKQVLFIKNSIEYIREHYAEKIYIRDLANLCQLNEQYFTRFFWKQCGDFPTGIYKSLQSRKGGGVTFQGRG